MSNFSRHYTNSGEVSKHIHFAAWRCLRFRDTVRPDILFGPPFGVTPMDFSWGLSQADWGRAQRREMLWTCEERKLRRSLRKKMPRERRFSPDEASASCFCSLSPAAPLEVLTACTPPYWLSRSFRIIDNSTHTHENEHERIHPFVTIENCWKS